MKLTLKHKFIHPLKQFFFDSSAIGIVLVCCTVLSLVFANLPATSDGYTNFWNICFVNNNQHSFHFSILRLPNSFLSIINDFLMSFFFLLVGMEIKRELLQGELSSVKNAALPVVAAFGGMLMPAAIYYLINQNTNYKQGWAIPTATDIAFTLGILSLLRQVPVSLKVFLTALAIIDDLGAVIVIAFFYGSHISFSYSMAALILIAVLVLLPYFKIRFGWLQIIIGFCLWYVVYNSGIHASVAGVIFATFVPSNLLKQYELKLHNVVYFAIVPLFALANTAIHFSGNFIFTLNSKLSLGIIAGLCIGKPAGIFIITYLTTKLKWTILPKDITLRLLLGAAMLAGIGFTMSLFITNLAFANDYLINIGKVATLIGSVLSIFFGVIFLKLTTKNHLKKSK